MSYVAGNAIMGQLYSWLLEKKWYGITSEWMCNRFGLDGQEVEFVGQIGKKTKIVENNRNHGSTAVIRTKLHDFNGWE